MSEAKIDLSAIVKAFGPKFLSDEQIARLTNGRADPAVTLHSALQKLRGEDRIRNWEGTLGKWVLFPHSCGVKFWLRLGDTVGVGILRDRRDDPATKFLLSRLTKGGVFFDFGANHGWFTMRAANAYRGLGGGSVFAYEPQDELFQHLTKSIAENGLDDIATLTQVALGDENKSVSMTSSLLNSGGAQVILAPREDAVRVPMRRFDEIVPDIERVDCMKIDIEGAEPRFFTGAQRFIETFHPVIYCEINQRKLRGLSGIDADAFVRQVESFGYSSFTLSNYAELNPFTAYNDVNDPAKVFNLVFQM